MTIDEAIKHAKKVAEVQEEAAKEWHENQVRKCELIPFAEMDYTHENNCKKCADEHRQLAEWLKELKAYKEQEPCEDAVSRKAVINEIFYSTDNSGDVVLGSSLRERIARLSSVTPIRPKGHWIEQIDHEENCRTLICSNCDRPALHDGDSIWKHKFCPHCGADMREVEE